MPTKAQIRPLLFLLIVVGSWLAAGGSPSWAQDPPVGSATVRLLLESRFEQRFVPGEAIVKLKATAEAPAGVLPQATVERLALDSAPRRTSGGELIFRLAPSLMASIAGEDLEARTLAMIEELRSQPDVEYAQPNFILQIASGPPNDPRYSQQWHYQTHGSGAGHSPGGINLPAAWETTTGDRSIVVAVIDTGIVPAHEDLAGSPNLAPGFDMISDPAKANDGDGRDNDPTDPGDAVTAGECGMGEHRPNSWHGTHVAGTVGVGKTDNALGVAGVNWHVTVLPVRALGKCGGTIADINDAIRWAAGLPVPEVEDKPTPAKVINLSLAGRKRCSESPATQRAIDDAVAAGATVVVAAGNFGEDAAGTFPASCENVITVAASDRQGRLATRYSNYGAAVEIMAPGGDVAGHPSDGVLSMVKGGYAFYNGTSMAAPHVSGVAALMLAVDRNLSPAEILRRLQANALPRSAAECPRPCGAGLLNANFWTPVLALSPSALRLRKDRSGSITATVKTGGTALEGVAVEFRVDDPAIATVTPATAITDAAGRAEATVEGRVRGKTAITVQAQDRSTRVPVKVPTISNWALLLAAVVLMVAVLRRYHGPEVRG